MPIERLQALLRELLQLDLSDLDFGIYRLLSIKRDEVEAFLEPGIEQAADEPFEAVLINGDPTIPGVRSLDPIFKARISEGESE